MKSNSFYQLLFALFITSTLYAAENKSNEPVIISGAKFTYPLIEKWITEYAKVNPNANIKLILKSATPQSADLNIIAYQPKKDEIKENQEIIYIGRYALLPVTNSKNPLLSTTVRKRFGRKEIDKLFFEVINFDEDPVKEKPKFPATIYSRDNAASASTTLAEYFGHVTSEIRGKKVFGDDIFLLSAILKDSIGITYNNLGYLFDVNSRKLKDGIALLPLDFKKDSKNIQTGSLDELISILEKNQIETIPVQNIGFVISPQKGRREVSDFLKWVLNEGQKFNHEKGFLNLDEKLITEQNNLLSVKLLTLK